ncbi:Hypothetical predicted protein [Marmota monax]|uniref:Uncharacterized protein n=1 Tax=Marmota monax TaxID=9995 RepID=A0A5E4D180_MARMO|nr:hypothetical protein GHT09_011770 [Marmota monax]VTJ86969.1 Hypothetical predicted protein [Marmota monax]
MKARLDWLLVQLQGLSLITHADEKSFLWGPSDTGSSVRLRSLRPAGEHRVGRVLAALVAVPCRELGYPSLWSVSNGTITPGSQPAGVSNGLGAQFFRGSPANYAPLTHAVSAASSSGSPLYEGAATVTDVPESQYDAAAQGRLITSWTPVSPPSM